VAVIVQRQGDAYTAQIGPPELDREWLTDRAYGRVELRRILENLGVHPIDVADAFDEADRRYGGGTPERQLTSKVVDGPWAGLILAACAVVLAILGLTPSLRWIPEIPLLVVAGLVPIAILLFTGYRSARRTGEFFSGPLSGAVAGAIGGTVGGVAYFVYGKPFLNVLIGFVAGLVGGLGLGALGAAIARLRH